MTRFQIRPQCNVDVAYISPENADSSNFWTATRFTRSATIGASPEKDATTETQPPPATVPNSPHPICTPALRFRLSVLLPFYMHAAHPTEPKCANLEKSGKK